jgi:hypothetical protein
VRLLLRSNGVKPVSSKCLSVCTVMNPVDKVVKWLVRRERGEVPWKMKRTSVRSCEV